MGEKVNFHAGKSLVGGTPSAGVSVGGTDLGFLFEGGKQFAPQGRSSLWVGGVFGDTFRGFPGEYPGNDYWRAPVMMRSSNTDFGVNGIKWDNAARGGNRLIEYPNGIKNGAPRRTDKGCFSLIPNDAIQLPDGHYMMSAFRVKNWDSDVNQGMAHTHSNIWLHSTEPHAEKWEWAADIELGNSTERGQGYQWWNNGRDQFFQNATFLQIPGDDYVYVFGTPEGRHKLTDKAGIYLRRCHWKHLWERSKWEFWGWTGSRWEWGTKVWPTPILRPYPGKPIGEINAQYLGGKVRLTYCDGPLGAVCRTADAPDAPWSLPRIITNTVRAPYAPSLHPWNTNMEHAAFTISSWDKVNGKNITYGCYTYRANIEPPALSPTAEKMVREVYNMTPEAANNELVKRGVIEALS